MRKKLLALLLISVLVLAAACPLAGALATVQSRVIDVGFFAFAGYHEIDSSGARSGYGYELLQRLYGYADWRYNYVGYDKSWSENRDMLASGEIELLTSAQLTADYAELFDYSEEPVGYSSTMITARAGNAEYSTDDYAGWNGARVGLLKGNSRNESFADYAAQNGFTYTPVYYETDAELSYALCAEFSIDLAVTSDLRAVSREYVVDRFDTRPFYIIVKKGNDALLAEINEALGKLVSDDPMFINELHRKYYGTSASGAVTLTPDEREFVRESEGHTFVAVLAPDRKPMSYFENGEATGFLEDITSELVRRTGLDVSVLETSTREEYRRIIEAGQADIILEAEYDYSRAEDNGYKLTSPYVTASVSRLYLKKRAAQTGAFTSLALIRGSDLEVKYGARLEQEYSVRYYDNVEDAVKAIRSGEVDMGYCFYHVAESIVYDDPTNSFATDKLYGMSLEFCVAVKASLDSRLLSILDKAVASLDDETIEDYVLRHTTYAPRGFTVVGYLYDNPISAMIIIGVFLGVVFLAFLSLHLGRERREETRRLLEEQKKGDALADALSEAERADRAKSTFLSSVSHEMRTPLNAIIGFMTLAEGSGGDVAKMGGYIEKANVAAKQLLSVINDVLDMSAIESGHMKLASVPFNLKTLLTGISEVYLPLCRAKRVGFEIRRLNAFDDWVVGDQLRLNQILLNLLANSVKFTESGKISLLVRKTETRGNRVFMRFEVRDTGCGMSEQTIARIWRPFKQESADTARKYGGSGLGLSIVKNLVAMMDGAVRVESVLGEGTKFVVDIPFTLSEMSPGSRIRIKPEELRVLVADDLAGEREYFSAVLGRLKIDNTCVCSGAEAHAELACAERPYNVCFIDWKMPGEDGVELVRRLRQEYPEMFLIIVSAYEHYSADAGAFAAGADMFLSKPLPQSAVYDILSELTGGKLSADASDELYALEGIRVLLAEDNALNRMVAVALLEKHRICCDEATDGNIAYDMFVSSKPGTYAAILMDVRMPNMDGFTATRAIRASGHPDARTVPIIALTANAFNEDVAGSLQNGMDAHVAKPIDVKSLMSTLERLITRRKK